MPALSKYCGLWTHGSDMAVTVITGPRSDEARMRNRDTRAGDRTPPSQWGEPPGCPPGNEWAGHGDAPSRVEVAAAGFIKLPWYRGYRGHHCSVYFYFPAAIKLIYAGVAATSEVGVRECRAHRNDCDMQKRTRQRKFKTEHVRRQDTGLWLHCRKLFPQVRTQLRTGHSLPELL